MSIRQAMPENNSNKITLKIDPNRREIMVNGSRKCLFVVVLLKKRNLSINSLTALDTFLYKAIFCVKQCTKMCHICHFYKKKFCFTCNKRKHALDFALNDILSVFD